MGTCMRLTMVALLLGLSTGCAVLGYTTKPEGAMDLKPVQASKDEMLHYWIGNVSGITFGGKKGMHTEFEACTIFRDKRLERKAPSKGLYVRARASYRDPNFGALAWGYLSLSFLAILPAYSGSGGFDVHFTVTRDGTEIRTYHYKIYRHIFAWLPLAPLMWMAALTADEEQVFAGLTRQFFHDAIRDGVFDEQPPGMHHVDPKSLPPAATSTPAVGEAPTAGSIPAISI